MTGERGPAGLARDNLDVHYEPSSRTSRATGARTGIRDRHLARDPSQRNGTIPLAYTAKGRRLSPARPSRWHRGSEPGSLIETASAQTSPSKKAPSTGRHKLDDSAGGPATRSSESEVGP